LQKQGLHYTPFFDQPLTPAMPGRPAFKNDVVQRWTSAAPSDCAIAPIHFSVVPEGGKAPELIPELARYGGEAASHLRVSADPFLDVATVEALVPTGRKSLVVAGFASEVVVVHAVRSAIDAGYRVYVPVDACGGMSSRTEDAAFRQIEAVGGVTTAVVGLVAAFAPDFSRSPGRMPSASFNCSDSPETLSSRIEPTAPTMDSAGRTDSAGGGAQRQACRRATSYRVVTDGRPFPRSAVMPAISFLLARLAMAELGVSLAATGCNGVVMDCASARSARSKGAAGALGWRRHNQKRKPAPEPVPASDACVGPKNS
jgi:Isochorismatase family